MTLRTLLVKLGFKGDIAQLTRFDSKITSLKGNIIGLSAIFATVTASLGYFVNEAAKMERVRISFKVLAGGLDVSRKLLKDILEFAATTPFEIPNVLETTKSLLAFGIQSKDMVDTMREVGDVSAGMDKDLNVLAQSYGRVVASGRLLGRVLYNLRLQGVPITEYLLKVTGEKTTARLDHLVSQGKISSEIFIKAWSQMRQERFMNVLFEQAQTFLGILSNIKDQITLLAISIGDLFLPKFKDIAWYVFEILQKARKFFEDPTKTVGFVQKITYLMTLLDKGLIRIYYRISETVDQFGGMGKVLKAVSIIFGTFVGIKTLTLLGKFTTSLLGLFNIFSHWKLTLLGAGIILLIGAIDDFLSFMAGKEKTITGEILKIFEEKYPAAFRSIRDWLLILKDEIVGLTLLTMGLFKGLSTGDWELAKEGIYKIDDAYKKIIEKKGSVWKALWATTFLGNLIPSIGKQDIKKGIGEAFEGAKWLVSETFTPGGKPPQEKSKTLTLPKILDFILPETIFSHRRSGESLFETSSRVMLEGQRNRLKGLEMPININVNNNGNNMDEKKLAKEIKLQVEPTVNRMLDTLWRNEANNLRPREY
jgi:hypothetical protein